MLTRKMDGDTMRFYVGSTLILTVEETEGERGITMALKGELRKETAHYIQNELDAFTTVGVRVTMDFQEVTYITASILKALLNSQKVVDVFRQGEIVLKNIPPVVYRELEETGYTELLMIEE